MTDLRLAPKRHAARFVSPRSGPGWWHEEVPGISQTVCGAELDELADGQMWPAGQTVERTRFDDFATLEPHCTFCASGTRARIFDR